MPDAVASHDPAPRTLQPGADAAEALAFYASTDPERVLLEIDDRRVTYAEAHARADAVAARLVRDHGEGGGRVALRFEDTEELLVCSIGVLRAGMTSVSVDPAAPLDLVADLVADVDALVLIDGAGSLDGEVGTPVRAPAELWAAPAPLDFERLAPAELGTISFTSGSTGRPKGIMVPPSMRPSVRMPLLESAQLTETRMRVGFLSTGSAGPSELGTHAMVTLGATAAIYHVRAHGVAGFARWLLDTRVAVTHAVPTMLRQAMAGMEPDVRFPDLRTVILSGETVTWEDVEELRRHLPEGAGILNMFGQTETLGLAMLAVTPDVPAGTGPLPIGHPMPGRTLRIVDDEGRDVPDGEVGELLVEDAGVALGYWKRPDLTERTFVDLGDGRRRVHTGDRVRRRPDGMLEHAGRTDHLVKVGAVRIELGQVEAALRELEGVTAAAARTYTDAGGRTRLAGYVATDGSTAISSGGARAALARLLPSTMLPTVVVPLDEIPQLTGGKVDRKALPEPRVAVPSDDGPPEGDVQELLAGLFADALGIPAVGADDDFFELGGDSLAAVEVLAGVESALGIDVPPSTLVEAPTVAQLATLLELDAGTWPTVVPIRPEGDLTPLVVVHAIEGEVFFAALIARDLAPDRPVLGIRASATAQDESIEQMATRYVEALRAARPSGPYALYGYSFGSYVALEMARSLVAAGEVVEALVLGDAAGPGHSTEERPLRRGLVVEARVAAGRWRRDVQERLTGVRPAGDEPPARRQYIDRDAAARAAELLAEGRPVGRELRTAAAVAHHAGMLGRYRPSRSVDVPAMLVVAARGALHRLRRDGTYGWARLVGPRITTFGCPGDHSELARSGTPHVAEAIELALQGR